MADFDSRFQHHSTFRALALLFAFAAALAPAEVRAQASDRHNMPAIGSTEPTTTPSGTGTVTALNTTSRKVTLDHGPVAAAFSGSYESEGRR
jgi:Cu/Ag efflux protein CusF